MCLTSSSGAELRHQGRLVPISTLKIFPQRGFFQCLKKYFQITIFRPLAITWFNYEPFSNLLDFRFLTFAFPFMRPLMFWPIIQCMLYCGNFKVKMDLLQSFKRKNQSLRVKTYILILVYFMTYWPRFSMRDNTVQSVIRKLKSFWKRSDWIVALQGCNLKDISSEKRIVTILKTILRYGEVSA